jgi:hypothetical protein
MIYRLSDNVIARIAQIIQEGMLMGIDVVDLMRQIEVEPAQDNDGQPGLDLTKEYSARVEEHYMKMLAEAEVLHAQKNTLGEAVFSDS